MVPLSSFVMVQVRESPGAAVPLHSLENVASYPASWISDAVYAPAGIMIVVPAEDPGKAIKPAAEVTVIVKSDAELVPPSLFTTSLITVRDAELSSHEPKVSPWAKWAGTADSLTRSVNALDMSPAGTWHIGTLGVSGGIMPLSSFVMIQVIESPELAKPRHSLENVASYPGSKNSETE